MDPVVLVARSASKGIMCLVGAVANVVQNVVHVIHILHAHHAQIHRSRHHVVFAMMRIRSVWTVDQMVGVAICARLDITNQAWGVTGAGLVAHLARTGAFAWDVHLAIIF